MPRAGICFAKLAETPSVLLAFEALPSCGDPVKQQLQLIRRVEWHDNETHMYIYLYHVSIPPFRFPTWLVNKHANITLPACAVFKVFYVCNMYVTCAYFWI